MLLLLMLTFLQKHDRLCETMMGSMLARSKLWVKPHQTF
ncbi:unnamed protein product [Arabidopsis halleri]